MAGDSRAVTVTSSAAASRITSARPEHTMMGLNTQSFWTVPKAALSTRSQITTATARSATSPRNVLAVQNDSNTPARIALDLTPAAAVRRVKGISIRSSLSGRSVAATQSVTIRPIRSPAWSHAVGRTKLWRSTPVAMNQRRRAPAPNLAAVHGRQRIQKSAGSSELLLPGR